MKKLKISEQSLQIRPASLMLGTELRILKISKETAFSMTPNVTFWQLANNHIRLHEGEYYNGYVAVDYGFRIDIVYMNGYIHHVNPDRAESITDQAYARACRRGELCTVLYPAFEQGVPGVFNYVWTFQGCAYEAWVKDLKFRHLLGDEVDEVALAQSLKNKLTLAVLNNEPVELADEEHFVLQSYAPDYYKNFFMEVEE